MSINTIEYKKVLSQFVTGVTIVSTIDLDGKLIGFTANSFSSVSINPPLISVCIDEENENIDLLSKSKCFSINILRKCQKQISNKFASYSKNKFNKIDWHLGTIKTPIIKNTLGWFECLNYNQVVAGDHIILLGEVVHYGKNDGSPLVFFNGKYTSLENIQV